MSERTAVYRLFCDRCQCRPGEIPNLGECLCGPCMDAELAATGVNILVQVRPDRDPYVINTARDAGTLFLPTGYTAGSGKPSKRVTSEGR